MTVLVIAEHDHGTLKPATLNAITAAKELGLVTVLIAGYNCQAVATSAAGIEAVEQVLVVDDGIYQNFLAEVLAPLVVQLATDYGYLIAAATTFGKNLMPRVAAMLDVAQISDIIAIDSADTFKRPIYAGNAIATIRTEDKIKVITVRETAFDAAVIGEGKAPIKTIEPAKDPALSRFVEQHLCHSERPELTTAAVVVSGGRGMQTSANFHLLESLADLLGGAVGATRAAVDAGFISNDHQIGQTGKIVAPDLYIAVGISGAIQHVAGIMDSKVIVAINKDKDAPIFQVADYGLVTDLLVAVPELLATLKNGK